jgi:hypothetical protein
MRATVADRSGIFYAFTGRVDMELYAPDLKNREQ